MGGRRMSKVWEEGKKGGGRGAMWERDKVYAGERGGRGGQRENTECDSCD